MIQVIGQVSFLSDLLEYLNRPSDSKVAVSVVFFSE